METKSKKIDATAAGTIDLTGSIDRKSRVSIGVTFYNSGVITTPTDGTYTITVSPVGMNNFLGIIGGENVDATLDAPFLSYSGNATVLRYVPSGIAGVDKIEITLIGEE